MEKVNEALKNNLAIVVAVLVLCILALAYCCYMNMMREEEMAEALVSRRVGPAFNEPISRNRNYWSTMYSGGVWKQTPDVAQHREGMNGNSGFTPEFAVATEPGSVSVSGITSSGSKLRFAQPRSDTGADWSNWSPAGESRWRQSQTQFDFEKPLRLTGGAVANYNPYFESALAQAAGGF